MSKEKSNKKANSKGITLVALVVTIVVLLILAGITITMLFGDNGIIKQAQKAKELTEQDQANTQQGLANLEEQIDNITAVYDKETAWNLNKVNKKQVDGQNIPVPKGYSLSKATGENSIATGLVLYEGEAEVNDENVATARTTRNQFVWIPISDTELNNMVEKYDDTNYRGKLYDFGFNGFDGPAKNPPQIVSYSPNSGYREPAIVDGSSNGTGTKYDGATSNINPVLENKYKDTTGTKKIQEQFRAQLQAEFNNMVASVDKYKGFYIGRYETSGLSDTDTTVKPTVQKGKTMNKTTWYKQYNESKNIKANNKVTSSMIWGCQWDAVLRWFQTSTIEKVKNFPTNSASYGNYKDNTINYVNNAGDTVQTTEGTGAVIPTGSSETTNINNIYDMAGNVSDWTIEAGYASTRIYRRR